MTAQHLCGFYAVRSQDGFYLYFFLRLELFNRHLSGNNILYGLRTIRMEKFYSRLCEREHNCQSHTNAGEKQIITNQPAVSSSHTRALAVTRFITKKNVLFICCYCLCSCGFFVFESFK